MNKAVFATTVTLLLCALGCSRQEKAATAQENQEKQISTENIQSSIDAFKASIPTNPAAVLVEVDGQALTLAQANEEVHRRMSSFRGRLTPEQKEMFSLQILGQVIDQFVSKTLLLAEADRRGIAVTDEDQKKALDEIQSNLPEGMTVEDIFKTSSMGKEALLNEVRVGIRINKLLGPFSTGDVAVTKEELDAFYAANREQLDAPERVHARHILLRTDNVTSDAARVEKRAQIEKLRNDLLQGSNFADMAREYSDCSSSQDGGDLKFFTRGSMVPSFEEAAFGQKTNEIGPVVETQFGYHIVQVLEREAEKAATQEKIAENLKTQKRHATIKAFLEDLRAKAAIKRFDQMQAE